MLNICPFYSGSGKVPDQLVNLDMKHGVEAKNYEEVSAGDWIFSLLLYNDN